MKEEKKKTNKNNKKNPKRRTFPGPKAKENGYNAI
jgi:hypothetical protein